MRKRVNALDNLMTSKAVDALINYETVKLFTNEGLEVGCRLQLICCWNKTDQLLCLPHQNSCPPQAGNNVQTDVDTA